MSQASEKQINFIIKLMAEKNEMLCSDPEFINMVHNKINNQPNQLTKVQASQAIDILMATPSHAKAKASAPAKTVGAGFYKVGDNIYKVQVSPNSGYAFAKVLSDHGFVYAKGAIKTITPADKLTLEDAKAYGHVYGSCIICQRTLTDETSISNGIGPICEAKYFG